MMLKIVTDAETISLSEVRHTAVLPYSELEIETNLECDRQLMRNSNAGKDGAFDNYTVQLCRHNQSAD